jgi:predicted PurR-regulated permease PerM
MVKEFDAHSTVVIPSPPESVKSWPLIGEQVYQMWTLAATDTKAILLEVAPKLKPLGSKVLDLAGNVLYGLLEFIVSIIIAGFLYAPGRRLLAAVRPALGRISGARAEEMVKLAGSTIRNVSRGVVGIALLQALLAGVGFMAVGIRGAGFLSFLALILGIIQIGPSILILPVVIWSWTALDTTTALIFTAYMIPVSLLDNVLRPVLVARGLTTPMPVILVGVLGGTIAYGISGLFLGPIILSVAWALAVAWVQDERAVPDAPGPKAPGEDAPERAQAS